jgi:enoyl-CoA hydratase
VTSPSNTVLLDRRPDGIAVVTLNNPPVNALTTEVFAGLLAVSEAIRADRPGAVVLAGAQKVFALGGEISETYRTRFENRSDFTDRDLDDAVARITDPVYVRQLGEKYLRAFGAIANLPVMTIAAVEGITFGGGLELALACDYRIAGDRAKLAAPEVTLGGGTIGGGIVRMPQLIGPSMTKKMYLAGRPVAADEALRMGLVDEVVSSGSALDRALELARTFLPYAGPAQEMLKIAINEASGAVSEEAGARELEMWCASYATDDARARLRSFFANRPQS